MANCLGRKFRLGELTLYEYKFHSGSLLRSGGSAEPFKKTVGFLSADSIPRGMAPCGNEKEDDPRFVGVEPNNGCRILVNWFYDQTTSIPRRARMPADDLSSIYWDTPRLAAGYPSNLIQCKPRLLRRAQSRWGFQRGEAVTLPFGRARGFKPRVRYNLIFTLCPSCSSW